MSKSSPSSLGLDQAGEPTQEMLPAEWSQSCPEVGGTAGAGGDPWLPCMSPHGAPECHRSGFATKEESLHAASCERSQLPVACGWRSAHRAVLGTSHRAAMRLPRVPLRHPWR